MQLRAGLFLQSTTPGDPVFAGAIIFLIEYNISGAMGFIVNRPYGRFLHELEEFRHSRSFPLYNGGPVDTEHLFFLHRRPDFIKEGTLVAEGVFSGGNFQAALNGINNGNLSLNDMKLFVGYCGWDTGDLEAEIEEGSWVIREGEKEEIFEADGQA